MYYFMSNIYGNADAYFTMKHEIEFCDDDRMYILGNIFDGNTSPEYSLAILEDIMQNENITLLLGIHEYNHLKYHMESDELLKKLKEKTLKKMHPDGERLMDCMNYLSKSRRIKYIAYLSHCKITDSVKIGNRIFYLTSGAPVLRGTGEDENSWITRRLTGEIQLDNRYEEELASELHSKYGDEWSINNTIIICGNEINNAQLVNENPELKKEFEKEQYRGYQRVILKNNKLLLNCGCGGDDMDDDSEYEPTLACVAVDETGYKVTYRYGIHNMF